MSTGRSHKITALLRHKNKRKRKSGGQYLLISVDKHPHSDIISTEIEKLALVSLLEGMKHPYLYPVEDFDYFLSKGQAFVIRRVAQRGSLKDLICGVRSPLSPWTNKYGHVAQLHPLSTQQCAVYGRQILNGLKALQTIGLRFPHLATSNIMLSPPDSSSGSRGGVGGDLVCRISELESTFLAVAPRYSAYFAPLNDRVSEEVIAFGHVLYEMAVGKEMRAVKPSRRDIKHLAESLQKILRKIFDPEQQIGSVTIDSLLEESFFTVTMNQSSLVEICDPNPIEKVTLQQRALLDKLAEYIREHNGMSEAPSELHRSATALIRKKQKRDEGNLARSLSSLPTDSGQWLR